MPPPEIFLNFNCLKCPLLASGVNRTIYLQVAFFLDGALQTYEFFHQFYLFVLYSEISDRFPENGRNRYGSAPDE